MSEIAINEPTAMTNLSTTLTSNESIASSFVSVNSTNDNDRSSEMENTTSSTTMETTTTSAASTTATTTTTLIIMSTTPPTKNNETSSSDPCSNDNPEWEEETLPCLNSHMFEGSDLVTDDTDTTIATATDSTIDATATGTLSTATDDTSTKDTITTMANVASTEDIYSTSVKELPSIYSCNNKVNNIIQESPNATESNSTDSDSATNSSTKENTIIYLRFNYEMYTVPNRTESEMTSILESFERQLGYGVANALGLVDCLPNNEMMDGNRKLERYGGLIRRSLQKHRMLESAATAAVGSERYEFEEISIEPLDMIDTTLCESRFELYCALVVCILFAIFMFNSGSLHYCFHIMFSFSGMHIKSNTRQPKSMYTHPRIHDRPTYHQARNPTTTKTPW